MKNFLIAARRASHIYYVIVYHVLEDIKKSDVYNEFYFISKQMVIAENISEDYKKCQHILIRTFEKISPENIYSRLKILYKDSEQTQFSLPNIDNFAQIVRILLRTDQNILVKNTSLHQKNIGSMIYDDSNALKATCDTTFQFKEIQVFMKFNDWRDDVISWFNEFKNSCNMPTKPLYLWGKKNTGKTTFIRYLLKPYRLMIYDLSKYSKTYAWNEYDKSIHKIIFADNFSFKYYDFDLWKKAIAGKEFSCPIRQKKYFKLQQIRSPIIFVSEKPLPSEEKFKKFTGLKVLLQEVNTMNNNNTKKIEFDQYFHLSE